MIGLTLYTHIPFCSSKCHFCSWVAHIPKQQLVRSQERYGEYTDAVMHHMHYYAAILSQESRPITCVYFGGGTPTVLSAAQLGKLFLFLRKNFDLSAAAHDVTLEASPETVDVEKLCAIKESGFNRISFGAQSLDDEQLRRLGRAHTKESVKAAVHAARDAGFENINVDLMFGLPGQTLTQWENTVNAALRLNPDHLSLYLYKQIPGTVTANQRDKTRSCFGSRDGALAQYLWAVERLADHGYNEYVFQLFERDGKQCAADVGSFTLGLDYIGFGAGAHSLLNQQVFSASSNLTKYLAEPSRPVSLHLARESAPFITSKIYSMMHTDEGVNHESFSRAFGISLADAAEHFPQVGQLCQAWISSGLVDADHRGFRFKGRESRARWFCAVH
jgi:oxygen-independent coproporphyrinogen-3 oxidase